MSERGRSSLYLIFTRLIQSLKPKNINKKGKFIDSDYMGNTYYELPADPSRGKRNPRRWFNPIKGTDTFEHPEVPPEWESWLRQRRDNPPTKEEIEYNLMVEKNKKRHDKPKDDKEIKKHPYSDFPTYSEYETTPGTKYFREQENKTKK